MKQVIEKKYNFNDSEQTVLHPVQRKNKIMKADHSSGLCTEIYETLQHCTLTLIHPL
jgi:hypothetical protein